MTEDPEEIYKILTQEQRQCILDLSDEWKSTGYNKSHADILYSIGGSDLYGKYPELVDCTFHRESGVSPYYKHHLLPKGLEVQSFIKQYNENLVERA